MSAIFALSILALAPGAFAGYHHGHAHGHQRLHPSGAYGSGSGAPYAYPTANSTGIWGTTGYGSSTSVAAAASTNGHGGNTYVIGQTLTETVYSTIHLQHKYASSSAAGQCAADVTVTNTEKVYVTVTAGQTSTSSPVVSAAGYGSGSSSSNASPASVSSASSFYVAPAYSAPAHSSSSAEAAPVSSTSSSSAAAYVAPISSSSEASPETASSTSMADTTTAPQYSSSPVPATSAAASPTSYAAASGSKSGTATASAPASYSSSSSSSGKRGLAYNDASLTTCFEGSNEISWAYNWVSSSDDLSDGVMYIPTLWGDADTYTNSWNSDAKSAISSGATHLFSFNEPDHTAQANLSPEVAATAYKKWMNPFNGQAKLCAPAVTNGGGSMGLSWLQDFFTACDGGCNIDCINIHWYDSASNTAYFKEHIDNATSIAKDNKVDSVFLSEFGATGSDDEVSTFLQTVMPYMDSNDAIAGYAYYMVSDGLLVSGTEPSSYGSTYKTYTSTTSSL